MEAEASTRSMSTGANIILQQEDIGPKTLIILLASACAPIIYTYTASYVMSPFWYVAKQVLVVTPALAQVESTLRHGTVKITRDSVILMFMFLQRI